MTCSARTWRGAEENRVEVLLTFHSEEDRFEYIKRCSDFGEVVAPLTQLEKLKVLLKRNTHLLEYLVIKNRATGEFEEIKHTELIGLRASTDDGLV